MILSGLSLIMIIASIPALIIAAAGHEYAHAKAADLLGDPTPRMMGRLTMNPFVHLDLIGSLALIIGGFGWAKPVVVNPTNFKDPRTDDMIVSIHRRAYGESCDGLYRLRCYAMPGSSEPIGQ